MWKVTESLHTVCLALTACLNSHFLLNLLDWESVAELALFESLTRVTYGLCVLGHRCPDIFSPYCTTRPTPFHYSSQLEWSFGVNTQRFVFSKLCALNFCTLYPENTVSLLQMRISMILLRNIILSVILLDSNNYQVFLLASVRCVSNDRLACLTKYHWLRLTYLIAFNRLKMERKKLDLYSYETIFVKGANITHYIKSLECTSLS